MNRFLITFFLSCISAYAFSYDAHDASAYQRELQKAYSQYDPANCIFIIYNDAMIGAMAKRNPAHARKMYAERELYSVAKQADFYLSVENYKAAENLYLPFAQNGHPCAQGNLANVYALSKNWAKAKSWGEAAASQDNHIAMTILAAMYFNGEGVKKNRPLAKKLYDRAAWLGNAQAKKDLGRLNFDE